MTDPVLFKNDVVDAAFLEAITHGEARLAPTDDSDTIMVGHNRAPLLTSDDPEVNFPGNRR
jgi:hypothetical protein